MFETNKQLKSQLLDHLKGKWSATSSYMAFSDSKYYLPTLQEFADYIGANQDVLLKKTELSNSEGFDCDDYSFLLKGHIGLYNRDVAKKEHSWAVGIIWANFSWVKGFHAANLVATADNGFLLYELQYGPTGFFRFEECFGNVQLLVM